MEILKSSIGRLRLLSHLEGMSLLLILFVSMPLKYIFDMPGLNKILGSIHGGLFLFFVVVVIWTHFKEKWSFGKITWKVLLSSILPFGSFYIDAKVLKGLYAEERAAKNAIHEG